MGERVPGPMPFSTRKSRSRFSTDAVASRLRYGSGMLPQTSSLGLMEIAALRQVVCGRLPVIGHVSWWQPDEAVTFSIVYESIGVGFMETRRVSFEVALYCLKIIRHFGILWVKRA